MEARGWSVREDKDRDGTARRQELLDAARSVFERKGYGATTIADITAVAGVSRATFYVYFASKRDVFVVLAEQVRDRYLAAQELGEVDPDAVEQVLRDTIGRTFDVTIDHLTLTTVLDHQALADPDIRRLWSALRRRSILVTARYVQREAAKGVVAPVADAETLAIMGLGMNEMFAPRVVDGEITRAEAIEQMLAIWLAALGRHRQADGPTAGRTRAPSRPGGSP